MSKRKADRTKRNRPARRRDGRAGLQTRYTLGRRYPSALAEGPAGASWKSPAKPVPPFLSLSLDLRQVKGRLDLKVTDLGATQLKNIAEPIHVYSLEVGQPVLAKPAPAATPADQAKLAASKRVWVPRRLQPRLPGGGAYFALTTEWPLRRGLRSFPRRPL